MRKGDTLLTLYGLKSCDTCRKADKALKAAGHEVDFRDVRARPLDGAEIETLLDAFGHKLINTRSTTWRGLTDVERSEGPADLLAAHPALMKRPVIRGEADPTLGWDASVRAQYLGAED